MRGGVSTLLCLTCLALLASADELSLDKVGLKLADIDEASLQGESGSLIASETTATTKGKALPVDETTHQIHDDLTRQGLIGGTKSHTVDYRSDQDVEDQLAEKLVIDYQMDYTLHPTMDLTKTPNAKHAPPLEYIGLDESERDSSTGVWGWVRDFDAYSAVNISGFAFEKGKGFWLDMSKWGAGNRMPTESYTIDLLFKLNEGGGMRRIMSREKDSEEGLYVFNDKIVFWPHILHTNPDAFKTATVNKDEWVRVTLVRDHESRQITGYVNGNICWILDDPLGSAILPSDDQLNFFQDDQGYSSSGILGRIRIFDSPLDFRQVKTMGRHAVDSVYPIYTYGRRIYRNLVVADFQFQNTLISSVFTQYPMFLNNRTHVDPVFSTDKIEGRDSKVVLKIPPYGLTYAIDTSGRIQNFDSQEFTFSVLVKLESVPDQFQNILHWSNAHSQITVRVLNWQLILSTRDKGEDLLGTMMSLHKSRQAGATEMGERSNDYLQSSQSELLRQRMERRQARVDEAEVEEQRIREHLDAEAELEKQEGSTGPGTSEGAVAAAPKDYLQHEEEERELRVAAGLEAAPASSRTLSPEDYANKQHEWELSHYQQSYDSSSKPSSVKQLRRTSLLASETAVSGNSRIAARNRSNNVRARTESRGRSSSRSRSNVSSKDASKMIPENAFGPDGPLESSSTADDVYHAMTENTVKPRYAHNDVLRKLSPEDAERMLGDLLYQQDSEHEEDMWDSELTAHLPKTTTQQVDQMISDCFMRGGKWRFAPIDKCSLDLPEGTDIDAPPQPYDVTMDLASSRLLSIKTDKWVMITVARSLDGTIEFYVNGRRAMQFVDRNTTNTEVASDSVDLFVPDAIAPTNTEGYVGRFLVYDINLRSTEVHELVRGTHWSPFSAINVPQKSGEIARGPENLHNCVTFLPIWNARSSHPGVKAGATMLWVKNPCSIGFDLTGSMCGEEFTCRAQARSWMSCGTIIDSYCTEVSHIKVLKDKF